MAVEKKITIDCASVMNNAMRFLGIEHPAVIDISFVPHSFSMESQAGSKYNRSVPEIGIPKDAESTRLTRIRNLSLIFD
jgi:hypothetical protein